MKKIMIFIVFALILSACSKEPDQAELTSENPPELLEVSIVTPEKINVNEEIKIEAHVVQGNEKVKNADEVKFEIWMASQDEHEMLEAHNEENGVYSIKKTFTEGGKYFIVAHTTANRMHSMPRQEVTVQSPEQTTDGDAHNHEEQHSENDEHRHGEHHSSKVDFDFHVQSPVQSKQATELKVHLTQNEKAITGATVRYEIWQENQAKHDFIDAEENSDGAYSTPFTFESKGSYHVKIHVEKGNIHDHTEKTIDVK